MNRGREIWVLVAVLGVVLLVGAASVVGGVGSLNPFASSRDAVRPSCDQIHQDRQTVADALARNEGLVKRIEAVGPTVAVSVVTPCDDDPAKAVVRVTYATDDELDDIHAILQGDEYFGAAVETVRD